MGFILEDIFLWIVCLFLCFLVKSIWLQKKKGRQVASPEPYDPAKFVNLEIYGRYTKSVIKKKAPVKERGMLVTLTKITRQIEKRGLGEIGSTT